MDKILLIEDDRQIRELLPRYFVREGFKMETAANGYEGMDLILREAPALVLLDVNLPDIDGWSVLSRLRLGDNEGPSVIMLTGRSDVPDRLMGLNLGADDYIIKPFEPLEVVARVKAVLRRSGRGPAEVKELSYEGLSIGLEGRTVTREGKQVRLTTKEFDILTALALRPGKVIARVDLHELVWGDELMEGDHALDVHINKIRTKLQGLDNKSYITTLRGVGYKFEVS